MVFIVGQAEQAKEKSQLLQQLGQVRCVSLSHGWNNMKEIFSFSRNKHIILAVENSTTLMTQGMLKTKSKSLLNRSTSKNVMPMSKHWVTD